MLKKQLHKIKDLFKENWEKLNLLSLLTPFFFVACMTWFLLSDQISFIEGMSPNFFKAILENVAFYILIPALVISYLRFCIEKSWFFLWLTGIIASFTCREIHWDWAGGGVFVLLAILLVVGFIFYDKLRPQITSRVFINLFVVGILGYVIANFFLDQGWAGIPKSFKSEISFRKSLEEFTEIFGHSMMAAIVFLTPALSPPEKSSLKRNS